VLQLLFDKNRVTGVEVKKDGQTTRVAAAKEVILSAGAIESPRLLMLCGIGPRDQLEALNIPVRANLPVGYNLQDHPTCVIEYIVERPPTLNVDNALRSKNNEDYQQLLFFKSGYLGTAGAQGALAFFRSRYADEHTLYPDVYIHMSCSLFGGVFKRNWNLKQEVWESLNEPDDECVNKTSLFLSSMLLHPQSRGTVRLDPNNPRGEPLIDPSFLDDPRDAQVMKEAMRMQLQLNQTDTFQRLQIHPTHKSFPGWKSETLYSDSYLEKYVRHHTLSGHHASGTCKMARIQDSTAVVDPNLKVIGFEGLRIVDASILPMVPSGNTGAPTIMVAEKAADIIKGINSVQDIKLPQEVEEELEMAAKSG
jgi:choline dehydrogenase-like flavoprotein